MCGLFAYIGSKFNPQLMQKIAESTESRRGGHAWGIAWRTANGILRTHKRPGYIPPKAFQVARNAGIVIGHTRYATYGSPQDNINNHPHPSDGGWIMHNGTIRDVRYIQNEFPEIVPSSDCDSEVFAQLIEVMEGTRRQRIRKAVKMVNGSPFAFLGLWGRTVYAASCGNPLHYVADEHGVYLASLAVSLPPGAIVVKPHQLHSFALPRNPAEIISGTNVVCSENHTL